MDRHESAAESSLRFASRAEPEEIELMRQVISLSDVMAQMIEAMPDFVLVLNPRRQILAVNHALLRTFGISDPWLVLGKRPGEALGCIHSDAGPDGCGTGASCYSCGAVGSILEALHENRQASRECRITIGADSSSALDLMVMTTPVEIGGYPLLVCSLRDIAAQKRREVLERIFFHDVITSACGLGGVAELLFTDGALNPKEEQRFKKTMVDLTDALIDGIRQQQELLAAERGSFKPYLETVSIARIMHTLYAFYVTHDRARERILVLGDVPSGAVITDQRIVRRILGDLMENALEATSMGERVTLSARKSEECITFIINNPGVISDEVQLQLFQRSFSTKEESGRGIGAYRARLFGERYLKGAVEFTSQEPEGTTFTFTITKSGEPLSQPQPQP